MVSREPRAETEKPRAEAEKPGPEAENLGAEAKRPGAEESPKPSIRNPEFKIRNPEKPMSFEVSEPIQNSPFEKPQRYWYIQEGEQPELREGRRPPRCFPASRPERGMEPNAAAAPVQGVSRRVRDGAGELDSRAA
jgi:hypothetical protein